MLNEREIVDDVLKDERFLNVCLSFCAVESSPQIKPTFVDLIREEQDLHTRVFQFAQQRQGRYPQVWGDYGYQAGPAAGAYQAGRPATPLTQPWITPATQGMAAAPAGQQPWNVQAATQPWNVQAPQPWNVQQTGTQAGGVEVAGRQYGPY